MRKLITCCMLLMAVSLFGQQYPDRHSTDIKDAWVSCQATESPNKVRGESHWILYDLGNSYTMHEMTMWNINAYQQTDMGAQEIVVDYSMDGQNWVELGYHTLAEATSSSFYLGESAVNFEGASGRYVLITIISNYGHATCSGFSEMRIQATIDSTVDVDDIDKVSQISIAPNPFVDQALVDINGLPSGDYTYYISDAAGKVIGQKQIRVEDGLNQISISANDLASGQYIFSINYGPLVLSESFTVIK